MTRIPRRSGEGLSYTIADTEWNVGAAYVERGPSGAYYVDAGEYDFHIGQHFLKRWLTRHSAVLNREFGPTARRMFRAVRRNMPYGRRHRAKGRPSWF